jgi:Coenzyme PQQ synthesis protein D (PqqD)
MRIAGTIQPARTSLRLTRFTSGSVGTGVSALVTCSVGPVDLALLSLVLRPFDMKRATIRPGSRIGWREDFLRMIDSVRPASATRLHLLGEAGVLFDEESQAVCVLNATAAFVWCCLEDGLERDEVLTTIQQTYGVARAAAGKQIDALFLQ